MSEYKYQERIPEGSSPVSIPTNMPPLETTIENLYKLQDNLKKIVSGEERVRGFVRLPFIYYNIQNTNSIIEDANNRTDQDLQELKKLSEEIAKQSNCCLQTIQKNQKKFRKLQKEITAITLSHLRELLLKELGFIDGSFMIGKRILNALGQNKIKFKQLKSIIVDSIVQTHDIPDTDKSRLKEFVKFADTCEPLAKFEIEYLITALIKIYEIGESITSDIKRWEAGSK